MNGILYKVSFICWRKNMKTREDIQDRIDDAIKADPNKYRELCGKWVNECDDWKRRSKGTHRSHLGASIIGKDSCPRWQWLTYRGASERSEPARMIRLFNRGALEEGRVLAALEMIGARIKCRHEGRQIHCVAGNVMGSCDAVMKLDDHFYVVEIKTANDKSFKAMKEQGIPRAHFMQMQCYMGALQIDRGIHVCVNKNDDSILVTEVPFEDEQVGFANSVAWNIIFSQNEPLPMHSRASQYWFECKICDHKSICHEGALPQKNCRTCRNYVPAGNNVGRCEVSGESFEGFGKVCKYYSVVGGL